MLNNCACHQGYQSIVAKMHRQNGPGTKRPKGQSRSDPGLFGLEPELKFFWSASAYLYSKMVHKLFLKIEKNSNKPKKSVKLSIVVVQFFYQIKSKGCSRLMTNITFYIRSWSRSLIRLRKYFTPEPTRIGPAPELLQLGMPVLPKVSSEYAELKPSRDHKWTNKSFLLEKTLDDNV